jgi:hypothetical protein
MSENTAKAGRAELDLRIMMDWPETQVEPGQSVRARVVTTVSRGGTVLMGPLDFTTRIYFIRDADGDIVHDTNPVVGLAVGHVNELIQLSGGGFSVGI